jgi:hypothetical protein
MTSGIQGPGKPGAPASVPLTGGATPVSTGATFAVPSAEPASSTPIEQLRAGAITLDQYIDQKVGEATAHFANALSPADLQSLRDELADHLRQDPDLAALVKGVEIGRNEQ